METPKAWSTRRSTKLCYFKWTNCALCNLQLEMTQNLQVLKFIFEDLDLVSYRPRISTCTTQQISNSICSRFFQSFGKLVLVADSISFWILHVTVLKKNRITVTKNIVCLSTWNRYQFSHLVDTSTVTKPAKQ